MDKPLTETQQRVLDELKTGPKLVPALVAHKLIEMGKVQKTGEPGAKGMSHVKLAA